MTMEPWGSITHFLAAAAVVRDASMVFSPSTESATATRRERGLVMRSRVFLALEGLDVDPAVAGVLGARHAVDQDLQLETAVVAGARRERGNDE